MTVKLGLLSRNVGQATEVPRVDHRVTLTFCFVNTNPFTRDLRDVPSNVSGRIDIAMFHFADPPFSHRIRWSDH